MKSVLVIDNKRPFQRFIALLILDGFVNNKKDQLHLQFLDLHILFMFIPRTIVWNSSYGIMQLSGKCKFSYEFILLKNMCR